MIDTQRPPLPPNSATGRRRKNKKTTEVKEIEEWVCGGESDLSHESHRHAGQLAENITEERLLRSRLMELGKERFKFLSKYSYDKQRFVDKQKRKITAMKKVRGTTALSDTGSVRMEALHPTAQNRDISSASLPIRRSFSPLLRPKTVQFESDISQTYITKGVPSSRPNTVPSKGRNGGRKKNYDSYQQIESIFQYDGYASDSRPSTAGVAFGSRTMPAYTDSNRDKDTSKYGSKFPSVKDDPRFALLDNALSENYIKQTKLDVRAIIDKTNSLRQAGRTGTLEARKALELKVKQFMEERGIVF